MGDGRDLASLVVPAAGELIATGDRYEPFRLTGPDGAAVEPVTAFFRDLLAAGRSEATVRSYGMDLLRWFRFFWAAGMAWDQATQREARDFSRWLQLAGRDGRGYAPAVRAHSETVLRGFYALSPGGRAPGRSSTRSRWTGPGGEAVPARITTRWRRTAASAAGRYRPRLPSRVPRAVPTRSSTRSSPGCRRTGTGPWSRSTCPPGRGHRSCCRPRQAVTDPGRQLITVSRKGTAGAAAAARPRPDAFVWLRLYQAEMDGADPGRARPAAVVDAAPAGAAADLSRGAPDVRAGVQQAGSAATLHALRHTAAYRMADDPALPLTDVQAVLGHAQLTTTQIYRRRGRRT